MLGFDWTYEWLGDDVYVRLSQKERSLLLRLLLNVQSNPLFFMVNATEDDLEDIQDFTDNGLAHLMTEYIVQPEVGYDRNIFIYPGFGVAIAGNAVAPVSLLGVQFFNQSPSINNIILFENNYLPEGDWTVQLYTVKGNNFGKARIYLYDAVQDIEQDISTEYDFYSATNTLSVVTFNITVAETGNYHLIFDITGKNTSSGNYGLYLSGIRFYQGNA